MADDAPLFDRPDIVGITWGPQASTDGQPTDVEMLRNWCADFATLPGSAYEDRVLLLRSAADEIETLRAEVVALKKAAAVLSRKCAALQKVADGKGLDVTVHQGSSDV